MIIVRIYFFWVAFLLTACNPGLDASGIEGFYVAKYSFGTDKIQLKPGGIYCQWVSISGDSTMHETSGNWRFDSTSNYITIENKMLVVDGFGKLRKDYTVVSKGLSLLPVWRKFLVGRIYMGTDELTPYEKME